MNWEDLKATLNDEVSTILASDFAVEVVATRTVPHSGDGAITFPNFDEKTQGAKLIDTAVLYIDIRRSTALNLTHKPRTVAKLYSAFIRAMTHVAQHHNGHVRGIIGDRLMVLFDKDGAAVNAVECAFSMHTVGRHIINKHFKANEVAFGIGIDSGKMLATKTGIRRHGYEQANYQNLVWLGRPANVASKLTDLANEPAQTVEIPAVQVAYDPPPASPLGLFGLQPANYLTGGLSLFQPPAAPQGWQWQTERVEKFLGDVEITYQPDKAIRHKNPRFQSFIMTTRTLEVRPKTPPILMTQVVWDAYRAEKPNAAVVVNGWIKPVVVTVEGYDGKVFGGDVIHSVLKD